MSVFEEKLSKGSFVVSKAGHDRGSTLIVMDFNEEFAYLADGKGRKAANPKKKKLIHISLTSSGAPECKKLLAQGILPADSLIVREIAMYQSKGNKGEFSGKK